MLMFKAQQIVSIVRHDPKPWKFEGKEGVTYSASLSCFGAGGAVAEITVKAKTQAELDAKLSKYAPGKAAEVPIVEVTPMFRAGDRKASGYSYVT